MKQSFSGKQWQIKHKCNNFIEFKNTFFRDQNFSREKQAQFLNPYLKNISPFAKSKTLDTACQRILQAIKSPQHCRHGVREKICVYGDFDADGICSTIVMTSVLKKLGAEVFYYIPNRELHSHGLKNQIITSLAQKNTKLIITVDCATNEGNEVNFAKNLGVDVIITDHHTPDENRIAKDAISIVNPYLFNNKAEVQSVSADRCLAGVGVAWKFLWYLINYLDENNLWDNSVKTQQCLDSTSKNALEPQNIVSLQKDDFFAKILLPLLDLVAIGTIADCVPLVDDNRNLVNEGLKVLKNTQWKFLSSLLDNAQISRENLTSADISFGLAPRINAASRVGNVDTLMTAFLDETANIEQIVEQVESWNSNRKELVENFLQSLQTKITGEEKIFVLYNKEWSAGICGLISSRLTEKFGVPSIICTTNSKGKISASCRSIDEISIIKILKIVNEKHKFLSFGGHKKAAGFVCETETLSNIKTFLLKYFAKISIPPATLTVDSEIKFSELSLDFVEQLQVFQPFGEKNPAPLFLVCDIKIREILPIGQDNQHYKLIVEKNKTSHSFLLFFHPDWIEKLQLGQKYNFIVSVDSNYFRKQKFLSVKIVDIQQS